MKWPLVLEVARWEFLRFFKLKDAIIGLLTMLAVGVGFYAVTALVGRSATPLSVAVTGPGAAELVDQVKSPVFVWRVADSPAAALRGQVESREIDAALILEDDGSAELIARRSPVWLDEVQVRLDERRRRSALLAAGLAPEAVAVAFEPAPLRVVELDTTARGSALVAGISVGLMLLSVLIGNAYLLVGITGEKQLRITEQVVAAIRPQTWIDGKILGLSALTLANVALYLVPSIAGMAWLRALGAPLPALPPGATDPGFLLALLVFSSLGFLLWFTFFAAIAATVDDPNNSSRGGWMMMPMLPLGLAFAVIRDPDSALAQVLTLLPLSAPTVVPTRLLLTDVPAWEMAVAAAGLLLSAQMLRRAAGRIFELGMLMYGKEPTWPEMRRWLKERS